MYLQVQLRLHRAADQMLHALSKKHSCRWLWIQSTGCVRCLARLPGPRATDLKDDVHPGIVPRALRVVQHTLCERRCRDVADGAGCAPDGDEVGTDGVAACGEDGVQVEEVPILPGGTVTGVQVQQLASKFPLLLAPLAVLRCGQHMSCAAWQWCCAAATQASCTTARHRPATLQTAHLWQLLQGLQQVG